MALRKGLVTVLRKQLNGVGLGRGECSPCRKGKKSCADPSCLLPQWEKEPKTAGRGTTNTAALMALGKTILAVCRKQKLLSNLGRRVGYVWSPEIQQVGGAGALRRPHLQGPGTQCFHKTED